MCVQVFNELLGQTDPGNGGRIGIYFTQPEITPAGPVGEFRWDSTAAAVSSFSPEEEVRAVVESQFMAKWIHCQRLGHSLSPSSRILATGGASNNTAILQVSLSLSLSLSHTHTHTHTHILRLLLTSSMLMCMCWRRLPTQLVLGQHTEPNMVGSVHGHPHTAYHHQHHPAQLSCPLGPASWRQSERLPSTQRLYLPGHTFTIRLSSITAHALAVITAPQVYRPLCEHYAILESSICSRE